MFDRVYGARGNNTQEAFVPFHSAKRARNAKRKRIKAPKMFQTLQLMVESKVFVCSIIILSGKSGNYQLLNEGLSMQNGRAGRERGGNLKASFLPPLSYLVLSYKRKTL
jgi:hypothetical protein